MWFMGVSWRTIERGAHLRSPSLTLNGWEGKRVTVNIGNIRAPRSCPQNHPREKFTPRLTLGPACGIDWREPRLAANHS